MSATSSILWFAAFAGQVAWLFDMEIGYLLVYWACGTKQTWVLPLLTAVAFVIALTAFAVSLVSSRGALATGPHADDTDATDSEGLARFLGLAGVALNGIAMLVILAMGVPRLMLDPCK
jgi:hypothetical protein